jgi:hypothetical protein
MKESLSQAQYIAARAAAEARRVAAYLEAPSAGHTAQTVGLTSAPDYHYQAVNVSLFHSDLG